MNKPTLHLAEISTELAEQTIDTIPQAGIIMDPATLEKLSFRLTWDTGRLKKLYAIMSNTALHCTMITSNPTTYSISNEWEFILWQEYLFTKEEITKAKKDLDRYQSLLLSLKDIVQN